MDPMEHKWNNKNSVIPVATGGKYRNNKILV